MKNKIIFSQDLPGENQWLNSIFPGTMNLETVHSGKWNSDIPVGGEEGKLYQIPYSDNFNCNNLDQTLESYKSIYKLDSNISLIDTNWCYADSLLFKKNTFSSFQNLNNEYFQAFTFARCGTVFTEDLLRKKFNTLSDHVTTGNRKDIVQYLAIKKNVTIALTYRKNWWDWVTSKCIGNLKGYHHYAANIDWNSVAPITISLDDLEKLDQELIATWDYWCNVRCIFPNFDFYLLKFEDTLAAYSDISSHKKIPYDKKSLIANYAQAKDLFEYKFLQRWKVFESRCTKHLIEMGCETKLRLD